MNAFQGVANGAGHGNGHTSTRRFGPFEFDAGRAELRSAGKVLPLRPKPRALLEYMLAHPRRLLSKAELFDAVWPGVVVGDDSLVQCVGELRHALSDEHQVLIRTVRGRGYLFDVVEHPAGDEHLAAQPIVIDQASAPDRVTSDSARASPRVPILQRLRGRYGRTGRALLLALLLALPLAAVSWWAFVHDRAVDIDRELVRRQSIAVLPFVNLGGDSANDWFAAGVTSEIVTDVARLPGTLVIGQTTTSRMRDGGQDPGAIGRELGVRYLLTGGVARDGQAVKVTARLSAADGGRVLWTGRFDYPSASDWGWRSDVSLQIAAALGIRLAHDASDPLHTRRRNPDAVDLTMRAQAETPRVTTRPALMRLRGDLEHVLQIDPDAVEALIALAVTHVYEVLCNWSTAPAVQLANAEQYLSRAQQLNPGNPRIAAARGDIHQLRGEPALALAAYEEAVRQNSSDYVSYMQIASVNVTLGRFDEVPRHARFALRLNPAAPTHAANCHMIMAAALWQSGREAEAYPLMSQANSENPDHPVPLIYLAMIESHRGESRLAQEHMAAARKRWPTLSVRTYMARPQVGANSTDPQTIARLKRLMQRLSEAGVPD